MINGLTGIPVVPLYDGAVAHIGETRPLIANDIFPPFCSPLLRDNQHFRGMWEMVDLVVGFLVSIPLIVLDINFDVTYP